MKLIILLVVFGGAAISSDACGQDSGFGPEQLFTNQSISANDIEAIDLDGDGDCDVVAPDSAAGTLVWFESTAPGVFNPPVVIASGVDGAFLVMAADFDGDGDPDILSGSQVDEAIGWHPNLGNGVLGPRQVIDTSLGTFEFVVPVDIDGDGDQDLLIGNSVLTFVGFYSYVISGDVFWYENQGGGVFGPAQVIEAGAITSSGTAIDVDQDGDPDVVWSDSQGLRWNENQGGGVFALAQPLLSESIVAKQLRAVDFDGDGDEDLVFNNTTIIGVGVGVGVIEHLAGGGWLPHLQGATHEFTGDFDLGDIDGDGDLDVLGTNETGTLSWHENIGGEDFGPRILIDPTAQVVFAVDMADLDGDARPDIVYSATFDGEVAWRSNIMAIPPHPLVTKVFNHENERLGASLIAPGDLDGDGRADLVAGAPQSLGDRGRIRAWSPSTEQELWVRVGSTSSDRLGEHVSGLGDVDGDGVADVAAAMPHDQLDRGRLDVLSGATGALLFTHQGIVSGDRFGEVVAGGGDWDGDGLEDFAVGAPAHDFLGPSSGYVRVFAGGSGNLLATLYGLAANEEFGRGLVFIPDRDGDGKDELLVAHRPMGQGHGALVVLEGGSGLVLGSVVVSGAGLDFGTRLVVGADVNGDGVTEILAANPSYGGGDGMVWLFDGASFSVLRTHGGAPNEALGWAMAFTGDLNGDGQSDYVLGAPGFVDAGGRTVGRILPMDGATGSPLEATLQSQGLAPEDFQGGIRTGFGESVAASGDLNGDGFAEFAVGLSLRSTVWVLEGLNPLALYGDCARGTAGEDLLLLDGSRGGAPRRVSIPVGQAFNLTMSAPASSSPGAAFAVAGYLGVPSVSQQTALPGGVGTLCLPPLGIDPSTFLLTNNFDQGAPQLVFSTSAPWSLTIPGIPAPFTLTFQGVIDSMGGALRTTNAVILEVSP